MYDPFDLKKGYSIFKKTAEEHDYLEDTSDLFKTTVSEDSE